MPTSEKNSDALDLLARAVDAPSRSEGVVVNEWSENYAAHLCACVPLSIRKFIATWSTGVGFPLLPPWTSSNLCKTINF